MATTPNAAKAAVVTEVKQMLSGVDAALITEYRGLSVGSLATLRRALRPLGAEYKVYKNTLASRSTRGWFRRLVAVPRWPNSHHVC